MANPVGLALGTMASTFGEHYAAKKQQEHQDEQDRIKLVTGLVSAGLQSGTIANPDQAFQFYLDQLNGGKGQKGAKGKPNPGMDMLKRVVGATTQGGQAQTSAQSPSASPKFLTAAELEQQKNDAAIDLEKRKGTEVDPATQRAKYEEQMREVRAYLADHPNASLREGMEQAGFKFSSARLQFTPGSVNGGSLPPNSTDIYGQPVDPTKWYRQGTDPSTGEATFVPTEAPASQQVKAGTPQEFFKQREVELGRKLSAADLLQARNDYAKAGQAETPEQKMAIARAMVDYRLQAGAPEPEDVAAQAQSISLGGQDVPYVNLDSFTGEKSKNAARKAADERGIVAVTKAQADQLGAANTAIGSLNAFYESVKSKLPTDFKDRPLAQVEIPLKQMFQTDEDFAAATAWNITVLPQLRAMSITGRVPVFEYQQALNAQPKLTDTVGTAAKKMAIVQGVLERGARSILTRKGSAQPTNAIPQAVKDALKDKPSGRKYRVGGIVYDKLDNGTIQPSTATAP